MKLSRFIAAASVAMLAGCGGGGEEGPRRYTVAYVLSGAIGEAAPVSVTYRNAEGGTSQINATLPWTSPTFTATDGQFLYVSGQRTSTAFGPITATIIVNGGTLKSSYSEGQFVIATASGSCC